MCLDNLDVAAHAWQQPLHVFGRNRSAFLASPMCILNSKHSYMRALHQKRLVCLQARLTVVQRCCMTQCWRRRVRRWCNKLRRIMWSMLCVQMSLTMSRGLQRLFPALASPPVWSSRPLHTCRKTAGKNGSLPFAVFGVHLGCVFGLLHNLVVMERGCCCHGKTCCPCIHLGHKLRVITHQVCVSIC